MIEAIGETTFLTENIAHQFKIVMDTTLYENIVTQIALHSITLTLSLHQFAKK